MIASKRVCDRARGRGTRTGRGTARDGMRHTKGKRSFQHACQAQRRERIISVSGCLRRSSKNSSTNVKQTIKRETFNAPAEWSEGYDSVFW